MRKLEGRVAFITGVARGQGRSHALRLSSEGAKIIGVDICDQLDSVEYAMATKDDLDRTVELVEHQGGDIAATVADVRQPSQLQLALDAGVERFGRLDMVIANAGIMPITGQKGEKYAAWRDAIDVLLSGVYNTVQAAIPFLMGQGQGGSIVITSSGSGVKGFVPSYATANPGLMGYTAAKHGVVGLMRGWANALGAHGIRVNTVHPSGTNTPMAVNEAFPRYCQEHPEMGAPQPLLPIDILQPVDISNAIVWLCSDDARYVTGVALPVDGGFAARA